eukprot:20527-Heterococcus_DN1.PRE.3
MNTDLVKCYFLIACSRCRRTPLTLAAVFKLAILQHNSRAQSKLTKAHSATNRLYSVHKAVKIAVHCISGVVLSVYYVQGNDALARSVRSAAEKKHELCVLQQLCCIKCRSSSCFSLLFGYVLCAHFCHTSRPSNLAAPGISVSCIRTLPSRSNTVRYEFWSRVRMSDSAASKDKATYRVLAGRNTTIVLADSYRYSMHGSCTRVFARLQA